MPKIRTMHMVTLFYSTLYFIIKLVILFLKQIIKLISLFYLQKKELNLFFKLILQVRINKIIITLNILSLKNKMG